MWTTTLLRSLILPIAECVTKTHFWTYYQDSIYFDRWDNNRRESLSRSRLAEVWNAARNTALQQERLQSAGLPNEHVQPADVLELLAKLPPVRKPAFRKHFPTGVTVGPSVADWRYQSTAGTTDRMTVIADFRKRDYVRSSELRVLHHAIGSEVGVSILEIPPNACNVVCGIVNTGPANLTTYVWQAARKKVLFKSDTLTELRGRLERRLLQQQYTLPPIDPNPAEILVPNLDMCLREVASVKPTYLRGFPVYLLWLADRLQDLKQSALKLKAIAPYGGLASPVMMERIANSFRCPFVQKYGTSELGVIAAACRGSQTMHVFEDLHHVEILRHGVPTKPGEIGRVVVTDLINTAMPLIRYEVGDLGRWHYGKCICGRTTRQLEIMGRAQELIDSPNGILTASQVADTAFSDPNISNFRLEEVAPRAFEAKFVARPGSQQPNLDQWRERFAQIHGSVNRIRARVVPYVQPESSGKYRFVITHLNGDHML